MPVRKRYPNPISLRLVLAMFVFVLITSVFQSACGGGGGGSSAASTPASTITSVSVSCSPASVQTGQTSQCTGAVSGTGSYNSVRHLVRERRDDQFFRDVYGARHGRYGDRDRHIGPEYQQDRQRHGDRYGAAADHHFGFGLL